MSRASFKRKTFIILNTLGLSAITLLCILPFVHLFAVSLSSNVAAMAGEVALWPVEFTTVAYRFLTAQSRFLKSLLVTLQRVVLGTTIQMLLVVLTAYPLSKEVSRFRLRTVYAIFFAFTMFFTAGLIPWYIVVRQTRLLNTIWALVIPNAVNVWHVVLLLNFFRGVPKELEEAAIMDGAGAFTILFRIYLPVSLPALATILLFTIVFHWNSWFDGIIFLNSQSKYPLQSYLYTLVSQINLQQTSLEITVEDLERLKNLSEKTLRSAQIFLGALPIMLVYPFLQKFFIKGLTIGSVKG